MHEAWYSVPHASSDKQPAKSIKCLSGIKEGIKCGQFVGNPTGKAETV